MNTDVLLDRFRIHLLSAGRGLGTIRIRLGHLRQLAAVCPDLASVTRYDLEAFLAERRETHRPETRASIRSAFKVFYAWCVEEGFLDVDPAAKLAPVRKTATLPRVADDDDVRTALSNATPREAAIIMLARYGCLRRSEIANLKTSDRMGTTLRVFGKGEKERRVHLNPTLVDALTAIEPDAVQGYYFPGNDHGHITGDTVHGVVTRLVHINPHALRHAGASAAYRKTQNIRGVQVMLGHTSPDTTSRYVHLDEEALREVAEATVIDSLE